MKPLLTLIFSIMFTASVHAGDMVIVLSPWQSPEASKAQVKTMLQFLTGLPPASTATIMDGDSLRTIGRFTVPDNPSYRSAKARLKLNREAVSAMLAFAKKAHPPHADTPPRPVQAVNLPQVLRHIARNNTGDATLDVVILGSPLYDDPNEPEFSMAGGLVPSDGHLQTSRSKSPLGVEGAEALKGIRLHLGYANEDIFMSDQHRYFIERFWSLFLSSQGGALVTFTSDIPSLLNRVKSSAVAPDIKFELEQTNKLDMVRLRRARMSRPLYDRPLSRTPLPTGLLNQADNVEIGIKWDCSVCDIDLYARPYPGANLLYFGNTKTPQGEHVKDYMTAPSGQNGYETIFFTTLVDLEALDIVVNFYRGNAPDGINGILRLSADGRTYAHTFTLPAGQGNQTKGVEEAFNTGSAPNKMVLVI
ncbi:MAG: hypothetical protein ABW138_22090, partial [Candidatus Thiodiazotropha sp. 4PDIVS1]